MTADKHNKLISCLLLANGIVTALVITVMAAFLTELIVSSINSGNAIAQMISVSFILIDILIAVTGIIFVVPQLLGGWMLLWKRPTARTWGIVACILAIISFPIGTVLGVYGLWFLAGENGRKFYEAE